MVGLRGGEIMEVASRFLTGYFVICLAVRDENESILGGIVTKFSSPG